MSTSEQLLGALEETAKLLQKTQVNLKKCPKQRLTRGYIETRLNMLKEYWEYFKNAHQELTKITTREQRADMSYFANEDYYVYEDLYLCLEADLRDMLLQLKPMTATSDQNNMSVITSNVQSLQVKLPKITLPIFSGKYEEWCTFQDLFKTLVHENSALSNVQKLHYLKTSITGEAQALLKHINVTDVNYSHAWETLKQRYGNRRVIVTSILKRLFNQKKSSTASAQSIKLLLDTTTECLNNIRNLNINTDSWDPLIIFLTVQKLDPESHKGWEEFSYKINSDLLPSWDDLKKFLESKFRTLELVTSSTFVKERTVREKTFHVAATEKKCIMCNESHTLSHCKEFGKMSPDERSTYVTNNKLCYNCLLAGHTVYKCRVPMTCRICHKRHHSLLHVQKNVEMPCEADKKLKLSSHSNIEEHGEDSHTTTIASHYSSKQGTALLATAMVTVRNNLGHTITVRALIDQGSQACFISEKATQLLKLKRTKTTGSVVGVGSTKMDINHVVKVEVLPRWKTGSSLHIQAYVLSQQLTTKIPHNTIPINNWPHLESLELADSSFYTPGSIDLLLGVREYAEIIQPELVKGPPGTPCAQRTSLGWILFGEVNNCNEGNKILVMHHQVEIEDMLKVLWEIDTNTKRLQTREEKQCEEIYKNTHTRNEEGRFIVRLPFKINNPQSPQGNTKDIALKRLIQLEKRFKRQPKLEEEYRKVMEEYLTMGHMELIPKEEISKQSVYLPHHAVCREDKETTQTRVVFDPSCKGTNNVSLNEELLIGPVLQDDLRNLLLRWRLRAICFLADIHKMYRMILVSKEDTDFQRIVWRNKPTNDIQDYRLLTVTFGMAPAPYLAIRSLIQLASDEEQIYPIAAKIIREDFYVDDLMTGCDSVEGALEAYRQLKGIMRKGGFELKKWCSNNIDFMKHLDINERSSKAHIDLGVNGTIKALGISWDLNTDVFLYNLKISPATTTITKRNVLSDIQKLFDPLGWMSPTIVLAKIIVQKLWMEKVGWDESISTELSQEWLELRSDFVIVNDIRIPRWLHTSSSRQNAIQVHGFSDASMKAYAAVVYMSVEHPDGTKTVRLIAARTKVAPLKTISLPRLELCGAVLLSQLLTQVKQAMRIPMTQIYAWTDSTIVLSWLLGDPNKWKTFVANRVVQINENINSNQWYHVESQDNPADIASRGMLLKDLQHCDMWWCGPKYLYEDHIQYKKYNNLETDLERKEKIISTNLNITETNTENKTIKQFSNFQNLTELLKTISYCIRFLNIKNINNHKNILSAEEINNSLNKCIQLVQREEFSEEVEALSNKKQIKNQSILKTLNPYLDKNNIIRVGGRLRNAQLSNEAKHPIILGNKNNLTPLIIADAHIKTLHGGTQLMMCYIRNKYWIVKAKFLIKSCIHKCLICARHNAKQRTQLMGDLPKERVTPSRPFLHSGVDFAGPLQVLWSRSRGAKTDKAYIAIFICMATKAIHLELVGDLTSQAFIGAFRRFTARRGQCLHLYSDQGRNFIGANKELQQALKEAHLELSGDISETLSLQGTEWHFIPAYSPNFGGLWEAGVKSVKYHLKRILNCNLTFEDLTTLLCQIEACLNSRPLSPIDDIDTDNVDPLTPGHFLIGEAPIITPSPSYETCRVTHLSRWQHLQKLLRDFWKKWQEEYLSRLQTRPKWLKTQPEFEKGQIVLIKNDNLPPGKWAMGRITDKHPGPDGLTRVYSVKSGDSVVKRSISKLCYLPVDNCD